jgi:hypothetical protein
MQILAGAKTYVAVFFQWDAFISNKYLMQVQRSTNCA